MIISEKFEDALLVVAEPGHRGKTPGHVTGRQGGAFRVVEEPGGLFPKPVPGDRTALLSGARGSDPVAPINRRKTNPSALILLATPTCYAAIRLGCGASSPLRLLSGRRGGSGVGCTGEPTGSGSVATRRDIIVRTKSAAIIAWCSGSSALGQRAEGVSCS